MRLERKLRKSALASVELGLNFDSVINWLCDLKEDIKSLVLNLICKMGT